MTVLVDNQWALGEPGDAEVLMGEGTNVQVGDFLPDGTGDITAGDATLPGEDGTVFGRTFYGGQTLTLECTVKDLDDAAAARVAWRRLVAGWNAAATRRTAGAVLPLRMKLPGADPVRVYGQPRKYTPVSVLLVDRGVVPINLEFQASDGVFYAEDISPITLSLAPSTGGGFTWPITWPVYFIPSGERQDVASNDGDLEAWPVITFTGPIAQPGVLLPGGRRIWLETSLLTGQQVTLDTRPSARTITDQAGGSYAGALRGGRMADLALPPGRTDIGFIGSDSTLQSSCQITVRSAYSTP